MNSTGKEQNIFRRHILIVWVWLFSLGLAAAIWTITLIQIKETEERYIRYAIEDASSYSRIFQEHTSRTLQSAAQIISFIEYLYQERDINFDLQKLFPTMLDTEVFQEVVISDFDGQVFLTNSNRDPKDWNVSEHINYFHQHFSDAIYVGRPVQDPTSGRWAIYISQRINGVGNAPDVLVGIAMDPFYFTRLYESVMLPRHTLVSLNGADGTIRARISDDDISLGQSIAQTSLFKSMNDKAGNLRADSVIDGRERFFSYRVIEGYPLSIVVGFDVEELLLPFNANKRQQINVAILFTLAMILFGLTITFLLQKMAISREKALAASQAKTEFLSNMSHELRTPLNGILGYAELLKETLRDEQARGFASAIQKSGLHLLTLVNSILQLNKITSGHIELVEEKVEVRQLIEQAVENHHVSASRKGLRLRQHVAENVPLTVNMDKTKLLQILNNLLHNAVKFTDQGHIDLTVRREGHYLYFEVKDTGCGIAAEEQKFVFDKFFQVKENNYSAKEGTGLGMNIVRELVKLMGGEILLHSVGGKGTSVVFTLPLSEPPRQEAVVVSE